MNTCLTPLNKEKPDYEGKEKILERGNGETFTIVINDCVDSNAFSAEYHLYP